MQRGVNADHFVDVGPSRTNAMGAGRGGRAHQSGLPSEKLSVDLVESFPADVSVAVPVNACEHVTADAELSKSAKDAPKSAVSQSSQRSKVKAATNESSHGRGCTLRRKRF